MTDTNGLKERLEAALDRISTASENLVQRDIGVAESGELAAALEAERAANAQLEERVRAIQERQQSTVDRLEREVAELKAAMAAREGAVRRVRATNSSLRHANRALRQANAQGVGDADLINQALEVELESLRAVQSADRAELDDILSVLDPIVKEAANA